MDGGVVVLPGLLLVAEHAEGDDGNVDVALGGDALDQRGVGVGRLGLEVDRLDGQRRAR